MSTPVMSTPLIPSPKMSTPTISTIKNVSYSIKMEFLHYNGINNISKSNTTCLSIDIITQGCFTSFHLTLELETFLDIFNIVRI